MTLQSLYISGVNLLLITGAAEIYTVFLLFACVRHCWSAGMSKNYKLRLTVTRYYYYYWQ